jgi:hypothetical protein
MLLLLEHAKKAMEEVVDDVMLNELAKEEEVGYPKLLESHSSSNAMIVDYCPGSLHFHHSLNEGLVGFVQHHVAPKMRKKNCNC